MKEKENKEPAFPVHRIITIKRRLCVNYRKVRIYQRSKRCECRSKCITFRNTSKYMYKEYKYYLRKKEKERKRTFIEH